MKRGTQILRYPHNWAAQFVIIEQTDTGEYLLFLETGSRFERVQDRTFYKEHELVLIAQAIMELLETYMYCIKCKTTFNKEKIDPTDHHGHRCPCCGKLYGLISRTLYNDMMGIV